MNKSVDNQITEKFSELNFDRCRLFSLIILLVGIALVIVYPLITDQERWENYGLHIMHWYLSVLCLLVFLFTIIIKKKRYGNGLAIFFSVGLFIYANLISGVFDTSLDRGIVVYLVIIVAIGAFLFFKNYVTVILIALTFISFVALLMQFQLDHEKLTGDLVNSGSFTVLALVYYLNSRNRKEKEFRLSIQIESQKDTLEKSNEEILDSIRYAETIQNTLIPSEKVFREYFPDSFILFKPKQIVSGDFYFVTRIGQHTVVSVADCTGHGVPGALMSMLGISFLNEIVRKKEVTQANHVLNEMRSKVIEALGQTETVGSQKDGMDMSVAVINNETNILQFSGANCSIYVVNSEGITVLKGDNMPVAIYTRIKDFSNHEIQLHENDCIYLFSDGLPDQFGGPNGKKLKYDSFKKLISGVSQNLMVNQKEVIEQTLFDWMNPNGNPDSEDSYEQIDDITIIGLKIPALDTDL